MAIETSVINPRVIFVASSTPSDLTEGKLWYNTSDNSLYVSNGSSYVSVEPDNTDLNKLVQENALNILVNSAGASTTLNDWDEMVLDRFTDANGQLNTIDTGSSDAFFATDEYSNGGDVNVLNTNIYSKTGNTYTTVRTESGINGTSPSVNADVIQEDGNYCNARVTWYYSDATNANVVWNNTTVGGYVNHTFTNPNPSKEISSIRFQLLSSHSDTTARIKNIAYTKTVTPDNLIIQTNALSLATANPSGHQLYLHNTTAGDGNITYDVSFDNGSTWVEDQPINNKNTTVHNGDEMIIKIKLNGSGSGNTASAKDYAMMLFY